MRSAELNLIVQKVENSKTLQMLPRMHPSVLNYTTILVILINSLFTSNQYISSSWNFSNKSQIGCQRKFFWDLAELNMIIQKHAKVEKHWKCIQITWKLWYLVIKSVILINSPFTSNKYISWSWNFSNKSQIVCQGKNLWDLQSFIWLYKKLKTQKYLICHTEYIQVYGIIP